MLDKLRILPNVTLVITRQIQTGRKGKEKRNTALAR